MQVAEVGLRGPVSQKIPKLSGGLPGVGHLVEFARGPIPLLTRARKEHGDICTFNLGRKQFVLLTGPAGNQALFRVPDDHVSFREPYRLTIPIFGEGVVYDAEPQIMSEQTGFLMHSLRDKRMRGYAQQVADEVEQFLADWGDEGVRDLSDATRELTTYTSSRCLLGKEFRNEMSQEFAEVYHDLEGGVVPLAYINPFLPTPGFRRRDKARVRMREMVSEIVQRRRRLGIEGEDLVQTLMDAQYEDGRKLTEDEITGLIVAAIFAGHHTSATLSAWTGIELHRNPQYLSPVLEELERVYGNGREIDYVSLRELVHLERAIIEAGRLNPPLVMIIRKMVKPMQFGEYTIPEGAYIMGSPFVSHRIPEVFKNPNVFDPDRFSPERAENQGPFNMITWGAGRHKCLGMHFAIMQIKTLWAVLLRRYEFELVEPSYDPDFNRMVVGPKQPCRIRYRRRRS